MQRFMKAIAATLLTLAAALVFGCNKEKAPIVETTQATNVTSTMVTIGGFITSDGGSDVIERGICWSTYVNPDVSTNVCNAGQGVGSFSCTLTNLQPATTYYARAYACNSVGISYGAQVGITTLAGGGGETPYDPDDPATFPTGAINSKFTINENGDQVYFSQGNLQYQASTNTWRFAENQWNYVGDGYGDHGNVDGSSNNDISSTYSGWIDLFGWGTSGWNSGANCYQPWSTSYSENDYYPGGNFTNNLTGSYANADWGVYNAISNGGNQAGQWRTLTGGSSGEWYYIFDTRSTSSGIRYAIAQVAGVFGVILVPDDWSTNTYSLSCTNTYDYVYNSNVISALQWATLENAGAVFLPYAGLRIGTSVYFSSGHGYYWSSSYNNSNNAYSVFDSDPAYDDNRYYGFSVRLVRDCQ